MIFFILKNVPHLMSNSKQVKEDGDGVCEFVL